MSGEYVVYSWRPVGSLPDEPAFREFEGAFPSREEAEAEADLLRREGYAATVEAAR
jgi:hypothetical protein